MMFANWVWFYYCCCCFCSVCCRSLWGRCGVRALAFLYKGKHTVSNGFIAALAIHLNSSKITIRVLLKDKFVAIRFLSAVAAYFVLFCVVALETKVFQNCVCKFSTYIVVGRAKFLSDQKRSLHFSQWSFCGNSSKCRFSIVCLLSFW